jgi:hypothetical protein
MAFNKISKDPMRFAGQFLKRFDINKSAYRTQFKEDYEFSIANTRFVGSYPLISQCDIRPHEPKSSSVDHKYLAEIPIRMQSLSQGVYPPSIYICTDALPQFAKNILDQIKKPFVLVTGDSDLPIDRSYLGNAFDQIINNKYLLAWFAQNKSIEHGKLYSLPIGIDFHSKWFDPQIWGGGLILPALQEVELRKIFSESPAWSERKPAAYCDWIFSLDRGDRGLCKEEVDLSACTFPKGNLSRTNAWYAQSNCAFVISPSGAGVDCHRTWEALALGCVPIVKRHALSDLFNEMPVVIVDRWNQITQKFLNEQHKNLADRIFNYSNLFLNTWGSKIKLSNPMENNRSKISMSQFRLNICA